MPARRAVLDLRQQRLRVGHAVVGDAVRAEHDAVDAAAVERARRHRVGEVAGRPRGWSSPRAAGARSASRMTSRSDAGVDDSTTRARGAVGHDADRVALVEAVDEQAQAALHQLEPVLHLHRARDVDQERRDARACGRARATSLARMPTRRNVRPASNGLGAVSVVDAERRAARVGLVGRQRVHELLDPDGLGRRQLAAPDVVARERVGGGVDVETEGREVVPLGRDPRVRAAVLEEHRGRRRGPGRLEIARDTGDRHGARRLETEQCGLLLAGGADRDLFRDRLPRDAEAVDARTVRERRELGRDGRRRSRGRSQRRDLARDRARRRLRNARRRRARRRRRIGCARDRRRRGGHGRPAAPTRARCSAGTPTAATTAAAASDAATASHRRGRRRAVARSNSRWRSAWPSTASAGHDDARSSSSVRPSSSAAPAQAAHVAACSSRSSRTDVGASPSSASVSRSWISSQFITSPGRRPAP